MGGICAAATFELFGPAHLVAIALTVALPVGMSLAVRQYPWRTLERAFGWTIAGAILANEIVYAIYGVVTSDLWGFLRVYLPLHVCGAAAFLTAYLLVRRNQFLYEVAYFWGLGGTFQAILTPNISEGFPSYEFFRFFITHCGIVVGMLFLTLGLRMRPRSGSVLRLFLLTNAWLVLVALVNALIGANYMFLCMPPPGKSPLFFLPWPWYLLVLEAVGVAAVILLYLPFYCSNRRRNALDASRGADKMAREGEATQGESI